MAHQYFGTILENKRVLITGANRGLGLLMARRFLECGAKVAICSAPHEDPTEAVRQLQAVNPDFAVLGFKPNLTNEAELDAVMQTIEQNWGGLDILVNNAGIYPFKPFEEYPQELFRNVFDVNVTGLFAMTKKAMELIKKNQNGGAIVNTSSMAGVAGSMNNIGYTASKFAVEGLTLGMARELGRYHIRVNGVAPAGMIKTDVDGNAIESGMTAMMKDPEAAQRLQQASAFAAHFAPMGSYQCHPDEVINAFIFLASDAASFISGQTIAVSGACVWPAANPMAAF